MKISGILRIHNCIDFIDEIVYRYITTNFIDELIIVYAIDCNLETKEKMKKIQKQYSNFPIFIYEYPYSVYPPGDFRYKYLFQNNIDHPSSLASYYRFAFKKAQNPLVIKVDDDFLPTYYFLSLKQTFLKELEEYDFLGFYSIELGKLDDSLICCAREKNQYCCFYSDHFLVFKNSIRITLMYNENYTGEKISYNKENPKLKIYFKGWHLRLLKENRLLNYSPHNPNLLVHNLNKIYEQHILQKRDNNYYTTNMEKLKQEMKSKNYFGEQGLDEFYTDTYLKNLVYG